MSNSKSFTCSGSSFSGLLTIVFIVLKLTHNIDWSWWWVISPIWISISLGIFFMALFVIIAALFSKN